MYPEVPMAPKKKKTPNPFFLNQRRDSCVEVAENRGNLDHGTSFSILVPSPNPFPMSGLSMVISF